MLNSSSFSQKSDAVFAINYARPSMKHVLSKNRIFATPYLFNLIKDFGEIGIFLSVKMDIVCGLQ